MYTSTHLLIATTLKQLGCLMLARVDGKSPVEYLTYDAQRKVVRYVKLPGRATAMPLPMVNILSGGLHAQKVIEMQDSLIIPTGAPTYRRGLEMIWDVWHATQELVTTRTGMLGLADEGGFPAAFPDHETALGVLVEGIERAGYRPGVDICIAIDVASSHYYRNDLYHLRDRDPLATWVARYPIVSIEDGLAEEDWKGWALLSERLGGRAQLLGDDLFTTNPHRLQRGVREGIANVILIKPNQIGTLTETLTVMAAAHEAGYRCVVSARSGETEDAFLADLAVGQV